MVVLASIFCWISAGAQQVYFVDGYHGGVYGHYPKQYTAFINDMLEKHPEWRINLEIEPETWDTVARYEPENFERFRHWMADQSNQGRVEYVNPAYGQPYFYNISGESMIRQFRYGIRKLKTFFPSIRFTSYSTEEPCFTSALPQVLRSFGFEFASLKNPNTCWGGYTRNHGGEMIAWTGPDGTQIPTVPRYEVEALDPGSTWQTTASTNSPAYVNAALKAGIQHPVGMCLQDAGWKNGPWLNLQRQPFPTKFTTWRNYFENISTGRNLPEWRMSQEDVQVSLVWGAQVLQQIARQCHYTENKLTRAEKLASFASFWKGEKYPRQQLEEAWRQLMLAQHHDCWIVPYNGRKNDTWIDKVQRWTDDANALAESSIRSSFAEQPSAKDSAAVIITAFNPNARPTTRLLRIPVTKDMLEKEWLLTDAKGRSVAFQIDSAGSAILANLVLPPTGMSFLRLSPATTSVKSTTQPIARQQPNGLVLLETDLYRLTIDPARGGAITSLIARQMGGREWVDTKKGAGLNELRGYFFNDSSFYSSANTAAEIRILENGSLCAVVEVRGKIQQHPFTQVIRMYRSDPVIDVSLRIDWQGSPGIGDSYKQKGGYRAEDYRKAFYDDQKKLQTLFPVRIDEPQLFRDAPFDVVENKMENTWFRTWDSIKNNVLLNWVELYDRRDGMGFSLFTDHTTAYSHGGDHPLGLITQYAGVGLWGRNYAIDGPTEIHYALYPHKGNWNDADVWTRSVEWNNPPEINVTPGAPRFDRPQQLLVIDQPGLELTSMERDGNDLLLRFFNSRPAAVNTALAVAGSADEAILEELDGRKIDQLVLRKRKQGHQLDLRMRGFGISNIRLKNFRTNNQAK